ncbi:MAG TPA: NAD-dependent DNA ligase LigA [Candidatus Saccharimonadales bacterium]|nr:NAD-dependent DNA ligase LigA [Candidatus Saccharimonadales bacterium]
MSKKDAKERIDKLRKQIDEYRYRYHVLDDPMITDEIYDSLTRELKGLEEQFPEFLTPDSPTQRIGGKPLDKFVAVPHETPMLSLNDAFTPEELRAWIARVHKLLPEQKSFEFQLDLKMDGLACALIYEDGVLVRGLTRGDGRVGEDVTQNVRTINSVPLKLRKDPKVDARYYNQRVEVRGEIMLYKKDFEQINKEREKAGLPTFMNPRNTAAGTVRQLDPSLVAARPLKFHAYGVITEGTTKKSDEYELAGRLGFIVNPQATRKNSFAGIMKEIDRWEDKRHSLPFNTDGIVITVNDRTLHSRLGVVGKAPRGSIAYKYAPEQATTKVKDIFVSIGRTGAATPVAMLEPTVIAGSLVQMATLHNESEVKRKDIRIGDTVAVHKAGDIIPEVIESFPKLRDGTQKEFVMPEICPDCGTKLIRSQLKSSRRSRLDGVQGGNENGASGIDNTASETRKQLTRQSAKSTGGVISSAVEQASTAGTVWEAVWRCPNSSCPSRLSNQLRHFASKSALDIEGLGEKNVEVLLANNLVKNAADFYRLKAEDLKALERFADISANKLVAAIAEKKNPELHRFIYALGIRHVGAQTAVDLATHYKNFESLSKATIEELKTVEGIGEVVAESIVEWFAEPENQKLVEDFKEVGVSPKDVHVKSSSISGKKFVITGTLESMGREEAAEKVRSLGGIFQSGVGKDTDYLVTGDNTGQGKLDKAQKYGTKIVDEDAFLRLLK